MKIDNSFWLFLMVVGLGWWATTLYDNNVSVKKDNDRLQVDNDKQSKLIAGQSFEFNRINQITGTAYRNGIVSKAESQEKIIEYRTILKKEPTCDLIVPSLLLMGCSTTHTVYEPAPCPTIPSELTQQVLVSLPPDN
ncbi:hypothetical protein LHK12_05585 [Providencia rettgeri]|nr:hypothetical protein [Providencia rettgeri]